MKWLDEKIVQAATATVKNPFIAAGLLVFLVVVVLVARDGGDD